VRVRYVRFSTHSLIQPGQNGFAERATRSCCLTRARSGASVTEGDPGGDACRRCGPVPIAASGSGSVRLVVGLGCKRGRRGRAHGSG
jgi:hypothetical protein